MMTTVIMWNSSYSNLSMKDDNDDCCKLVSDEAREALQIVFAIVSGLVGLFGVGANGLNIAVFFKQGLKETSNISLFCLSVSDLLISLWTVFATISYIVDFLLPAGPVDIQAVYLVAIGNPLVYFSKLSMVTTMFLCFERCLCVILPLGVKRIVTRGRAIVVLSFFFIELTVCYAVFFAFNLRLTWQFDPAYNTTRLQMWTHPLGKTIFRSVQSIHGSTLTFACVSIVVVSTLIMVIGVVRATKKRQEIKARSSGPDGDSKSSQNVMAKKDTRLVHMVIYIAALFVISYTPILLVGVVEAFIETGLDMYGKYHNLNEVLWSIITALGSINAAGNIVIYYLLSEKYRTTLDGLLKRTEKHED